MAPQQITTAAPVIRCPLCDKRDVVPTMQRRWWDWFFKLLMKFPWVCRACGWRFYVKQSDAAQRS